MRLSSIRLEASWTLTIGLVIALSVAALPWRGSDSLDRVDEAGVAPRIEEHPRTSSIAIASSRGHHDESGRAEHPLQARSDSLSCAEDQGRQLSGMTQASSRSAGNSDHPDETELSARSTPAAVSGKSTPGRAAVKGTLLDDETSQHFKKTILNSRWKDNSTFCTCCKTKSSTDCCSGKPWWCTCSECGSAAVAALTEDVVTRLPVGSEEPNSQSTRDASEDPLLLVRQTGFCGCCKSASTSVCCGHNPFCSCGTCDNPPVSARGELRLPSPPQPRDNVPRTAAVSGFSKQQSSLGKKDTFVRGSNAQAPGQGAVELGSRDMSGVDLSDATLDQVLLSRSLVCNCCRQYGPSCCAGNPRCSCSGCAVLVRHDREHLNTLDAGDATVEARSAAGGGAAEADSVKRMARGTDHVIVANAEEEDV
ncbi:hypothetical protein BDZ90DRAFT_52652 [Jaminaea rosea]|uniref:Uncharacterized protein n=1 Tax=Jaminaea rosea TaxID=1569628 RepID=A0A316UR44_9BASI|nr:hypothetical protein BDZ90DRAFT_52652 [Jaminaea rosea]PWN26343.1 hypothetical protein BDZ90DRAFT_52652 [Jaminaea rosea]